MSQTTPVSADHNEPRRNKLLLALGAVVGTAAVVSAAYWYLYGSHFVSTDNAYAAVEIAQVTPSVGGTISTMLPPTMSPVPATTALAALRYSRV